MCEGVFYQRKEGEGGGHNQTDGGQYMGVRSARQKAYGPYRVGLGIRGEGFGAS